MIDRNHDLSITRQAKLVGISRSSVHYTPRPVSEADLALIRRIDELHMNDPFAGSRMLRDWLNRQCDGDGVQADSVDRKRVTRLMRQRDFHALHRKPGTSKRHPGQTVFPYLLRTLAIERSNQVWALDTTYIPMKQGFVYLTAVLDWASRKVLAHMVAITLEAIHAVDVLEQALNKYGTPDVINADQGRREASRQKLLTGESTR